MHHNCDLYITCIFNCISRVGYPSKRFAMLFFSFCSLIKRYTISWYRCRLCLLFYFRQMIPSHWRIKKKIRMQNFWKEILEQHYRCHACNFILNLNVIVKKYIPARFINAWPDVTFKSILMHHFFLISCFSVWGKLFPWINYWLPNSLYRNTCIETILYSTRCHRLVLKILMIYTHIHNLNIYTML